MTRPASRPPSIVKLAHRTGGILALLTIVTFMSTTLWSELLGTHAQVIAVKTTIPWGLLILIPALMATGASGMKLARGRRGGILGIKLGRMKIIAANGLLVLAPAALYLAYLAQTGAAFSTPFYIVQVAEILAGALNITLIALNIRDGLRTTAGRRRKARAQA